MFSFDSAIFFTMQHLSYPWDLTEKEWASWLQEQAAPPFVAKQIMEWLFAHQVIVPASFSNIAKGLQEKLQQSFDWSLPVIESILPSTDGSSKFLLKTRDHLFFESVLMPSSDRVTLCVSSQVGCRMGCTFCQKGKMGFSRNLSAGEILIQIILANHHLLSLGIDRRVTNVVFMGMGEPLDNLEAVVQACQVMIHPRYFGLSRHRVTVSTAGLVPEIRQLGQSVPVSLAISLHSADDAHRSQMMPINKKYSLSELKETLLEYPVQTRHGITFEYVMIQGVNDTLQDAKKLVKFVHGLRAKVNLIPMNPHPGSVMQAALPESIRTFQRYLMDRDIPAPVRYSRGQDVSAACGQLAAKKQEELNLSPIELARSRRAERRRLD